MQPFKFCRHSPSRRPATATCGDKSPHLQQPSPALTQTLRILAKFCIPSSHSSGDLGGMKESKWQMLAKRAPLARGLEAQEALPALPQN